MVVPSVGEIALKRPEVCNLLKSFILVDFSDHPATNFPNANQVAHGWVPNLNFNFKFSQKWRSKQSQAATWFVRRNDFSFSQRKGSAKIPQFDVTKPLNFPARGARGLWLWPGFVCSGKINQPVRPPPFVCMRAQRWAPFAMIGES